MAIVSFEKKAIFLANPGTGSTSVYSFLKNVHKWQGVGEKHDGYHKTAKLIDADIADFFVFTTVRNPYDFLVSEYSRFGGSWADKMREDPDHWIHSNPSVKKRIEIALAKDFDAFVTFYLDNANAPSGRWCHQYWGKANFVMMTENLNNDFRNVLRILRMGGPRKLKQVNATPAHYRHQGNELFTPELIEALATKYHAYLDLFEYEYEH